MLKNYYEIEEIKTVGSFLRGLNEKKNIQYIILDTEPRSFVDVRTMALRLHNSEEKLKNLKKPLAKSHGGTKEDHMKLLISSGDRVIETPTGFYDYLDALADIVSQKHAFLDKKVESLNKKEVYALNADDKISTARKIMEDERINLLPVIDGVEVVGELRPLDFLRTELFAKDAPRGDMYSENRDHNPTMNLPVSNILNKKPYSVGHKDTVKKAVQIMIEKKLPSLVVTDDKNKLHSVISYSDVMKMLHGEVKKAYAIEVSGGKEVSEYEIEQIETAATKLLDRISKDGVFTELKIRIKAQGNKKDYNTNSYIVDFHLARAGKTITIRKEMGGGTSDEEHNDKHKEKRNLFTLTLEGLKVLEDKLRAESSGKRELNKKVKTSLLHQ